MTSSIASLLMVLGMWLTLALLCCGGGRYSDTSSYKVVYRVDGNGRASVVYTNATGSTEMRDVTLPWTESFNGRYGEHLYLSAQDKGGAGLIVVSITVNGRIVKDAISKGEYTIATVSDRCCE